MTIVPPRWIPIAVAAPAMVACAWHDFDAVLPGAADPDAASVPTPAPDADSGPPDMGPNGDAASSSACAASGPSVDAWAFDAGTDSWGSSADPGVSASLTWTASAGRPSAGALSFAVDPGDGANQGAWIRYVAPLGDLTGRTLTAWVLLLDGPSPQFKVFAQTGADYAWGDGGTLVLSTGQWTCVSVSLSSPSYNGPGYDPADVITVGFETLATEPFHLLVDSVQID